MAGGTTIVNNGIIVHSNETKETSNSLINVLETGIFASAGNTKLALDASPWFRRSSAEGWAFNDSYSGFYRDRFSLNGLFLGDTFAYLSLNQTNSLIFEQTRINLRLGSDGPLLDLNTSSDQTTLTNKLGEDELILGNYTTLKKGSDQYILLSPDGTITIAAPFLINIAAPNISFTSGATIYGLDIEGATGLQGIQGETGILGLQGATGTGLGVTGLQGVTGTDGATGPAGAPQGVTGVSGETGLSGADGQTGVQGLTGISGLGVTGLQGSSGETGLSGSDGQTGIQGETGISGLGVTGLQGSSGETGLSGATGVGAGSAGPDFTATGQFRFAASGATIDNSQFYISGSGVYIPGKLTVDGLIDPTGLQLTPQGGNPGDPNTIWINTSGSLTVGTQTINPRGSTPEMVEWWVATDGNDTNGDGSKGNPFVTLQKAIAEAHLFDNNAGIVAHHHFRIGQGDYTGDGRTTFFGSSDGIVSWAGDPVETMIATISGEGEEFDDLFNIPVNLGPVAAFECSLSFQDVQISGAEYEGSYRPALALMSRFGDVRIGLKRCAAVSLGSGAKAAVWLGLWDNYALSGKGLWGPISESFGGFSHETCYFDSDSVSGATLGATITAPSWLGTWYGRDSKIISESLAHGGDHLGEPGMYVNGGGGLRMDWKNVNVEAFTTWPSARFEEIDKISILDCYFEGARPDIGDAYVSGWKYILEINDAKEVILDRNKFFDTDIGFDDTPGNSAVFLGDTGSPALWAFWGTNISTGQDPDLGNPSLEALFNVGSSPDWASRLFIAPQNVTRHIWEMNYDTGPPNPGGAGSRGWDCLSNTYTINGSSSAPFEVIGNGGSESPREALPTSIVRNSGGNNWEVQSVIDRNATPAAGAFPTVPGGTNNCIAIQWGQGQAANDNLGAFTLYNMDITQGIFRIIVPGAQLAIFIPSPF